LHVYCNDCRGFKKHEEYLRHSDKYKERAAKFYQDNAEAIREQSAQYRRDNIDRILATNQKWRDTHKEEKARMDREYREKNKEYLQAKNRAKCKTEEYKIQNKKRNQKYLATDKGRKAKQMNRERYRARKNGVSATLTKLQWRLCKEFFHHTCAYCGKHLKNLTQDHFIPLHDAGGYDVDNIIPCCKSCNSSKQNKVFAEWYGIQPFYDKYREHRIITYLALFK